MLLSKTNSVPARIRKEHNPAPPNYRCDTGLWLYLRVNVGLSPGLYLSSLLSVSTDVFRWKSSRPSVSLPAEDERFRQAGQTSFQPATRSLNSFGFLFDPVSFDRRPYEQCGFKVSQDQKNAQHVRHMHSSLFQEKILKLCPKSHPNP